MKTWIMMRHGKSSWESNVADLDRPLNIRGIDDAHRMGVFLTSKNLPIDAAYSSPAVRAAHTALIVTKELALPLHKLRFSKMLYDFSGDQALEFIRCLPDDQNTVITFGHNHACTSLAHDLGGVTDENIPTAAAVLFRFNVSLWSSITTGKAQCYFPKMIT
ncbi:MAG: histidine phosphatase family protein [Flavobacteriaceae bacterium]|nr:histidine phosphatase family protein [Flavobacteriaceae bacterium]